MEYQESVDWIHGRYGKGHKNGLENERALLEALGNPHEAYPCVHVAGTNGKGSVCAMIASAASAAGLSVGLYTSPYLMRYNERMRVDGEEIPDGDLAQIATDIRVHAEALYEKGVSATVFELGTACALEFFKRRKVDLAVIEVGLGGRLDPTNAITPVLSVITRIGLDHVKILGDTIGKIAAEKAGIIKPGVPCVLYPQGEEIIDVVAGVCTKNNSPFHNACETALINAQSGVHGHCFNYIHNSVEIRDISIPLPGAHQLDNARTALMALEELSWLGFPILENNVREGLKNVYWPGRLEWHENLLLDGAHNPQAAQVLADYIRSFLSGRRVRAICGIQSTKDAVGVARELAPTLHEVLCVPVDSPHPTPPEELARIFSELGVCSRVLPSLDDALAVACGFGGEDVLLVCGSLYLVGDMRGRIIKGG